MKDVVHNAIAKSVYLFILGALAVVVMLKAPTDLWGLLRDKTGVELFPVK